MPKQNQQDGFSIIEISLVVAVVAIIGALGWKFYDVQTNKAAVNNASEQQATIDITPDTLTGLADIATIQQDAVKDKSGVTVIHIELEQGDSNLVYKTELSDGTVVIYNAKTGVHIKTITTTEKTTETLPANFAAGIGFNKALEIARAEKPNSKVFKIELELEGGIVVYSVRFSDKARVDVNAKDGSIVRTKAAKVESNAHSSKPTESAPSSASSDSKDSHTSSNSGKSSTDSSSTSHSSGSDDDSLSHNDDDDSDDSDDDSSHDNDLPDDSGHVKSESSINRH